MKIKNFTSFSDFCSIFEGGSAIKTSRRIREDEFPSTFNSIKSLLFPIIGIDSFREGSEYVVIGSIGKKSDPSDTSGDIDIGYDGNIFSRRNGIDYKDCSQRIYEILEGQIQSSLGYLPEIKHMKGLNIVSIGWPIGGNQSNGTVQLDLIPLSDMRWARFIYYSPDYKRGESKYKSAHRNWLLAAILSARIEVLSRDEEGQIMEYDSPVLILRMDCSGIKNHIKEK